MVLIQYCKSVTCEDFDFAFFWGHRLFWGQKLVRSKNDNKLIERYLDNLNFIIKKFSPEINHYSKKVNFYCANKYKSPCTFIILVGWSRYNRYGHTAWNQIWKMKEWGLSNFAFSITLGVTPTTEKNFGSPLGGKLEMVKCDPFL